MTKTSLEIQIEAATSVLVSKALWKCTRAADLASFHFGERRKVFTFHGEEREVGEYSLNVQCPWRIAAPDQIIVGSADLYYPKSGSEPGPGFDFDKHLNRRDALIAEFFADRKDFTVRAVRALLGFGLNIDLGGNFHLEIFPNDSINHEHWRIFESDNDTGHFVVAGHGIEDQSKRHPV
jgi:hypothetical protein